MRLPPKAKCPGYAEACGEPLTHLTAWHVDGTEARDEWFACEECATDALREYDVATPPYGIPLEMDEWGNVAPSRRRAS